MEQQMSFAQSGYAMKKKVARRERFFGEMERVVPWERLVEVIKPHYPRGERGRPPVGIERMPPGHELGAEWHPFHVIENLFKHRKVRYRGLSKNTAQPYSLFTLANMVLSQRALLSGVKA